MVGLLFRRYCEVMRIGRGGVYFIQRPASETAVKEGRTSYYAREYHFQFGDWAGCPPATTKGFAMFIVGCIGLMFGTTFFVAILCLGGTRTQFWGSVGIATISMIFIHYGINILLNAGYTCRK